MRSGKVIMNDEYIGRNTLRKAFGFVSSDLTCPLHIAAEIEQIIETLEPADVSPVKYSEWESIDISYWRWNHAGAYPVAKFKFKCKNCGETIQHSRKPYCPNCGCKMIWKG